MKSARSLVLLGLWFLSQSCTQGAPPTGTGQRIGDERQSVPPSKQAAQAEPRGEVPDAPPTKEKAGSTAELDSTQAASDSTPPKAQPPSPPLLTGEDDTPLGQTEEKPDEASPWFQHCMRTLFDAIVRDEAELAMPCFFPKVAYAQVKAIKDPNADWERRLKSAFERDVHTFHKSLGQHRDEAKFSTVRVTPSAIKWVKPGEEGNRLGYFRAMRSALIYTDDQARPRELGIFTMISWRGQWAVVHLAPFK